MTGGFSSSTEGQVEDLLVKYIEKISCLIAADFLLHKTYDTAPIDL